MTRQGGEKMDPFHRFTCPSLALGNPPNPQVSTFPQRRRRVYLFPLSPTTCFQNRASRSRGLHVGESSRQLCDRLSRTRALSQRQLPTDHDYAKTREYQTDQSSNLLPWLLLALSWIANNKCKPPSKLDLWDLTGSLHIS